METLDSETQDLLTRLSIREVLEKYWNTFDECDWSGVASCFTEDAVSFYNFEEAPLHGGKGVADWLENLVQEYPVTNHGLSNLKIDVKGNTAVAISRIIATIHSGELGIGRVRVRGIKYIDELVKQNGTWRISHRQHIPEWQYDALSQDLRIRN